MILLSFILIQLLLHVSGQTSGTPECPDPWLAEGNKCYLFSETKLPWLDAKIACQKYGANLVSVNSKSEHLFLLNWFLQNDNIPDNQNKWYIGAEADSNTEGATWRWLDGSSFNSDVQWVDEFEPRHPNGPHIIYKYTNENQYQSNPQYRWYRDLGEISYRYICEISKADSNRIISKQRNFTFGADLDQLGQLYRGPYFVSQPHDVTFQVSVDQPDVNCDNGCPSASFDCEASGYPHPTYKWFERNAGNVKEVQPTTNSKYTVTNGHLTVNNPKKSVDTATYWCEATNRFGTIKSEEARINYIVLKEFAKSPKPVSAKQYEAAVIVCDHIKDPGVRYFYSWYMNNDPTNFVNSIYNNHIFLSDSGSLYFSAVFTSDAANYHCSVRVEGGSESRSSPAYPLSVDASEGYKKVGPLVHNDFPRVIPQNPKRGDTVVLECLARFARQEGEQATYTWSRPNGQPLPRSRELVDYDRKLYIFDVKPEDTGEYTCTVSYQTTEDSGSVTLSILSKPYFGEGSLSDQHQDQGDEFSWICLAHGSPDPTYSWLKNAKPFNENNLPPNSAGRIEFSSDHRSVTFKRLNKDVDPGMYQCAATNTHGTTYSEGQLRVLEVAPNFEKHRALGRILATENGNATIPCDPEAAPQATITWLKDGNAFSPNQDSKSDRRLLPNNYIFLSNIQRGVDEGVYTCVAENNVLNETSGERKSIATQDIRLIVVQRSRLAFGPGNKEVHKGDRVELECRADFNPILDLVYLWYHNDRLIDFDDWRTAQIFAPGTGVGRGNLIIKNVTYEERGQYKCVGQTKSDQAVLYSDVTVLGPPGQPAGLKASATSPHDAVLSWTPGADNGASIFAYLVEKYNNETQRWVQAKNVTDPTDVSSGNTTVTNLFAFTGYKFRIRGQNKFGTGEASVESAGINTGMDKPTTYPDNIRGGDGKEGTLVIQWDPLPREQWNAPSVDYFVEYKKFDGSSPDQTGWSSCFYDVINKIKAIPHGSPKSGKCVTTIDPDLFKTKFYIRVWARNSVGEGPKPDPKTAWSSVRAPDGTPQNIIIQPFNSTALKVFWDTISDNRDNTGGELTGVHIQYWPRVSTESLGRRATIIGNVTEGLIIGLRADTEYMVTAQLFNSAGDGRRGSAYVQKTWLKAPQNMPEYVTVNRTAESTLGVHFRGVVTQPNEEPLDGYKVRIWRQGEPLRSARDYDCGRRTWIEIKDNFEKNALYNLRVFAYSRGGVGKMSSPLIQFTLGCNRRPTNPEAKWVYLCDSCSRHALSYALLPIVILLHFLLK